MMKNMQILIVFFMIFSGCGPPGDSPASNNITAASKSKFPDFLIGTWRSDENKWEFTFSPDGTIVRMRHYFIDVSEIQMSDGGVHEELKGESFGVYTFGPCPVDYDPRTNELDVKISVEDFYIEIPVGVLEGRMFDHFTGKVYEDDGFWIAEWYNHSQIVDTEISEPSTKPYKQLVFRKIVNGDD